MTTKTDKTSESIVSLENGITLHAAVVVYGQAQDYWLHVRAFRGVSHPGYAHHGDCFRWTVTELLAASYFSPNGVSCGFSEFPIKLDTPVEVYVSQANIIGAQEVKGC